MNVYQDLLALKRFREQQAQLALLACRQTQDQARLAREQAEDRLQQFCDAAHQQELSLYDDLCSRTVRVREIEQVLVQVASLRAREAELAQEVEQAEAALELARSELAAAHESLRLANRVVGKFTELTQWHQLEIDQEFERREEMEMEEVASLSWDREGWISTIEDAL